MASTFWTNLAVFAQEEAAGGRSSLLSMLFPFLIIGFLFYFLLIRPQRQEMARRRAMLAELKKNDLVIAAGGIYGVVAEVDTEANRVTIKVDEKSNTKLRVTLSSVTVVPEEGTSNERSK